MILTICFPTGNAHHLQLHYIKAFKGSILLIIILKGCTSPCSQPSNSTVDKNSGIWNA